MKKKSLLVLSFILVASTIILSVASTFAATIFVSDGYSYIDLTDNYISIYGWDDSKPEINFPAQIDGKFVKEINNRALYGDGFITSVSFNSAIYLNRIGVMSFKGCTGLVDVSLPNRITEVGYSAFQDCSSIKSVEYYASSIEIPEQCFYNCASLKEVIIGDGVSSIGRLAFAECPQLTYVRIPSNVTNIQASAFKNNNDLVIYCYTGSYAQTYAEENGIDYVLIDAPTEPTTPTEPATQEPTSATEPSTDPTEPKAPYMLGDADNSGDIDVIDATFVQRYSIEAFIPCEDTIMQADVDNDSEVTSIDATYILRYLIHIKVNYNIGEIINV